MQERRKGDRKNRLLAMLVSLASFYFGLFVWPTPWRYDRVGKNPVRTNRVTGEVEILNLQGWQPALPPMGTNGVTRRRHGGARAATPCEALPPSTAPSRLLELEPKAPRLEPSSKG